MTDESQGANPRGDADDYLRANLAGKRKWNAFWTWPDKPIGEHGAAWEVLRAAGLHVEKLNPREPNQDPPDCEGIVDGLRSGVEVTELVHRPTLKRSIKAVQQREAGKEPDRPEAHFVWDREDLLQELQRLLDGKDRPKLKGGPYDRYMLVIHTNEFYLNRDNVGRFLEGATFRANFITDAFLGLSYHPASHGREGGYPVFRLQLTGNASE
jgi:hypothetical protein